MKTSTIILSIVLLSVFANAYPPYVNGVTQLPNVFVKTNEIFNADLSQYFTGYNLSFTTNSTNASVQKPLTRLANGTFGPAIFAGPQTFVSQTYPRDKTGNIDYTGYILYLTLDNYLYWGNISNYTSVPNMVYGFQLTPLKYAHCYEATQINNDLVVVDCSSTNATGGNQSDWFFFVSLSNKSVIATYNKKATAKTTYNNVTGKATRGVRVADFGKGNHFIFRYVGSDAISNSSYQNDCYIEVYKALNWTQPKAFTIISKGSLHIPMLSIAGFEVLNGGLFILNTTGTVFYIQNYGVSFDVNVTNTFTFPSSYYYSLSGFAVSIEYYKSVPQLTLLVYTINGIWEINWSIPSAPVIVQSYSSGNDMVILKADFTADYVIAHVNSTSIGTQIVSFRRGSSGFFELYQAISVTNLVSTIWWSLDKNYNNLYLWDANFTQVQNFHFQKSWLLFNSSTESYGAVSVTATSFGSDGTSTVLNATFMFFVINENDFSVYSNSSIINVTIQYPSTYNLGLDGAVIGPGINYTVSDPSSISSYTFQSYGNLAVSLPEAFKPNAIYYHKIAPNSSAPGTFNWLVQSEGFVLYNLLCIDSVNVKTQIPSLSCSIVGNTTLLGQVLKLVITSQYITVMSSDSNTSVLFLEPNLKLIANVSTGNPCADLVLIPSGSYLACSQTVPQQIILWDASHPEPQTQIVINRTQILESAFPIFSPSDLVVNKAYPDYLFVKNQVGVLVLDLAFVKSIGVVEVVSSVVLPNITNFDFIVNGNSVLFFVVQDTNTYIQEYVLNSDPLNPLFVKQYTQFFEYGFQAGTISHYSSSATNRFFAVVQDSKQTPELITFQGGAFANNNFLNKFNLGFTSGPAFLSGVHSSVVNAEYLFVGNSNANLSTFIVYDKTLFAFNAYLKNASSASEDSQIVLNATSPLQNSSSNVSLTFSVLTYNSNPPITPGKAINDTNALNFINFTTGQNSFVFNPFDFFNGTVTSWNLSAQNANDNSKISLQVPVNAGSTAFNASFNFFDLAITPKYIYAQGNRSIAQINASNTSSVLNLVDMTVTKIIPKYQQCTNLVVDDSYLYTTSFCMDTQNTIGYLVTVSFLSSSPSPLPPFATSLTSINSLKKIGSFIFLLENPNGQVAQPGAKLHVYDFSNPAVPVYLNYLSGGRFSAGSFQVGGWDYVNVTKNYYRFYLTDGRYGIHTIEWNSTSGGWVNPKSYNLFSDPNFQKDNIPYNALFLGIAVLQPVSTSVSNDTYVVLTTDIYNSYYVKLSFPPTGLTATLITIYKKNSAAVNLPKITAVYTNYTYFAVSSYINNTGEGFVTLYNATNSSNQVSQISRIPYPAAAETSSAFALFTQGSAVKFWASSSPIVSSVANFNTKASNGGCIQEYLITPFYSITILPNSSFTSTYVDFTASNNISNYTVRLNVIYNPSPSPSPPGSSSKWWIWLIVIVSILIIAGGIYAFVQYRNKKKEELEESSTDANAPLTTNYA